MVLEIPEYTFEEFKEIVMLRLKKEGILEDMAAMIAERVWSALRSRDIRDAIKVARLADNLIDVENIVKVMKSHFVMRLRNGI